MKLLQLKATTKRNWQNNKPFLLFVLSLLLILSILKIIFYNYNYHLVFTDADVVSFGRKIKMGAWSVFYDLLVILAINIPFLLLLFIAKKVSTKISRWFIVPLFVLLNSFVLLLNLVDIFYFRFHFQRANADLLFVLDHPFKELFHLGFLSILGIIISICAILFICWKIHQRFYRSFNSGNTCTSFAIGGAVLLIFSIVFKVTTSKLLVPTYPLINISSKEMLVTQNSFHTFSYSIFRQGQEIRSKNYFTSAVCDSLLPIKKMLLLPEHSGSRKNIVLFIMESIPYEFFDSNSKYKVAMPFFDSLQEHSTFYNNAFSYGLSSNKGITSILAGVPTLTEIPLYHSQFVNMPVTPIGKVLRTNGYSSFFCIGDDYDNFGFAKCSNWLGIEKYYCRDDMPAYKNEPSHTMGIHDEYVLEFMRQKINQQSVPFFAVNYNVSTHYPFDLPPGYKRNFPANYTTVMKSMSYYDYSLQQFFNSASKEPWFNNTIFIFCSDHWQVPTEEAPVFKNAASFHIPILLFNPSVNKKIIKDDMVSQFDILGTVLSISGYKDTIISYGNNLLDSNATSKNEIVFTKQSNVLYQAMSDTYVLGYNIIADHAEYMYNYRMDKDENDNLLNVDYYSAVQDKLIKMIKAFIQKATTQYNHQPFK